MKKDISPVSQNRLYLLDIEQEQKNLNTFSFCAKSTMATFTAIADRLVHNGKILPPFKFCRIALGRFCIAQLTIAIWYRHFYCSIIHRRWIKENQSKIVSNGRFSNRRWIMSAIKNHREMKNLSSLGA